MMRILGLAAAGEGAGEGSSCTSFILLFYKHVLSNGSPDGSPTGYVCRGALACSHMQI